MAKKKNVRNTKKKKGGRPTEYKAIYAVQVEKLCKLGATDEEIAQFFEINVRTLNRWKKDYPKFCQSIKKGKILADVEIADKLYNRASGYDVQESHCDITEEVVCPTSTNEDGKFKSKIAQAQQDFEQFKTTEDAKTVKYKKNEYTSKRHIPGDVTAQIFWLKNRRKKEWRDKVDMTLASDPDNPLELIKIYIPENNRDKNV